MRLKLYKIRKSITLRNGVAILDDKKIVSLMLRGFSDTKIRILAIEQFYYWDNPTYWENKNKGVA